MVITSHQNHGNCLSSSFVLGGSPCSGKSSLAERLSSEYQFSYYKVDDHMWRHLEQADPQTQPTMAAYAAMTWDEIWSQPVDSQVGDVFAYYSEQFPMILDDLQAYAGEGPIIMEGAAFLPGLIHSWGVAALHAVFLVPTKTFQLEYYSRRDWVQPILDSCVNPDQAFANWMERDHRFGLEIVRQAQTLGYPTITVDGLTDIEQIYQWVIEHFRLQQAEG
jgi:hypothetical protein